MTNKIMAEIEKILRVKKLLSDQELAPKVNLSSRRVPEKGYKKPAFDVVHRNKPLHLMGKQPEEDLDLNDRDVEPRQRKPPVDTGLRELGHSLSPKSIGKRDSPQSKNLK